MHHIWTGGQYSLYRLILGCALLAHFAGASLLFSGSSSSPLEWALQSFLGDNAAMVHVAAGCLFSGLLALGRGDRTAAWLLFFSMSRPDPGLMVPFSPVHVLLLLHVFAPPAPYGSLAALGRVDPHNGFRLPSALPAAAWLFLAATGLGTVVKGGTTGEWTLPFGGLDTGWLAQIPESGGVAVAAVLNLFFLLFGPLALKASFRPTLWLLSLLVYLTLFSTFLAGAAFLVLHLLAWNPAWLKTEDTEPETLFYDGSCGLCHRAVRFVLAEDPEGRLFQFAPLGGDRFNQLISKEVQKSLPDSLVLVDGHGKLMTQSTAVLTLLKRLGGYWRVLSVLCTPVPRFIRDGLYNGVAAVRTRIFSKPANACPILPPHVRKRFVF